MTWSVLLLHSGRTGRFAVVWVCRMRIPSFDARLYPDLVAHWPLGNEGLTAPTSGGAALELVGGLNGDYFKLKPVPRQIVFTILPIPPEPLPSGTCPGFSASSRTNPVLLSMADSYKYLLTTL